MLRGFLDGSDGEDIEVSRAFKTHSKGHTLLHGFPCECVIFSDQESIGRYHVATNIITISDI